MDIRPLGNVAQPTVIDGAKNIAVPVAAASARPAAAAVEPAAVIKQPDPAANTAQITQALKSINKTMEGRSQTLEFSIDEDSNRTIVKIVDQSTKIVIRQIPTGEVLEIAKALDQAKGLLIRQKA